MFSLLSRLTSSRSICVRSLCLMAAVTAALLAGDDRSVADDSPAQVYGRAMTAWQDGEHETADRLLSGLIADETNDPRVYYFRGLSRYAAENQDAAAVDFEAGAQLETRGSAGANIPKSLERVQGPARQLLENYRRQACRDADLQAGFYRGDRAKQQLYSSARSAYFRSDFSTTVELLDRVIEDETRDPRAYYFRGLALQELDRSEDAQADFARAVSLETTPGNQIDVDRALERVQGPARRTLEEQRGVAMLALRQKELEERRAMIAAILERRTNAGPGSGAGATARSAINAPPTTPTVASTTPAARPAATTPAATQPAATQAAGQNAAAIDTAWLDPETEVVINVRVADIWNSPIIRQFHDNEELKKSVAEMEATTGLTPASINSVTVGLSGVNDLAAAAGPAAIAGPAALMAGQQTAAQARENAVIVLRTKYPFDTAPIDAQTELFEKSSYNGKSYYRSLDPEKGPCVYIANLNTLVMADEPLLQQAIDRGADADARPEFSFIDPAKQISVVFAPADPFSMTEGIPDEGGSGSPGLDALAAAVKGQTLAVGLGIGLTTNLEIEAAVLGVDDTAATKMNAAFGDVLNELKGMWDLSKALAPEPVVPLVDSLLRSTRSETRSEVFAVSTRISQGQIEKLVADIQEMLPGLMMGALMNGGPGGGTLPPGAFPTGDDPAPTPPPQADRTAAGLQVTASAKIAQFPEFVDGKQIKPIELNLDLIGDDAAKASGYGFVELESATDNTGNALTLSGNGLTFGAPVAEIDHDDFFVEHPDNGCRATIRLLPPETVPGFVTAAKGKLKLFVVEDSSDVVVENVKSLLGQSINNPVLAAAGFELKVSEVTEDGETSWKIEWANPPGDFNKAQQMISGVGQGVGSPELVDADGNQVAGFNSSTFGFGNQVSVEWTTALDKDNPFPDDVRLRIKVNSKVSIVDAPFSVQNVQIAAEQ